MRVRSLFLGFIALAAATGASLAQTSLIPISMKAISCSSEGQLCNKGLAIPTEPVRGMAYELQLMPSPAHCSEIRFLLKDNATFPPFAVSDFLPGGELVKFQINAVLHPHVVVFAEGRVGGCNTGFLRQWTVLYAALTGS